MAIAEATVGNEEEEIPSKIEQQLAYLSKSVEELEKRQDMLEIMNTESRDEMFDLGQQFMKYNGEFGMSFEAQETKRQVQRLLASSTQKDEQIKKLLDELEQLKHIV